MQRAADSQRVRASGPTGPRTAFLAPGSLRGRGAGTLLFVAVLLSAAATASCRKGVGDLLKLGETIAPFERMPYVQAVDTARAYVLWRAREGLRDSLRYRVEGEPDWRLAEIRMLEDVADGPGAPGDSMVDRRALLTGLKPAARVEYSVFVDTLEFGPIRFETPPAPESTEPIRVLAFGDSGWGSESQVRLAELMEDEDWDLAVHTGDIAYTYGTELDFTLRHFHVYQRLLSTVPFFPSPGDHDLRTDGGAPYDRAFVWPAPEEGARWYTFRWGMARFIALETGDESPAGRQIRRGTGPQIEWLRGALESASREPDLRWIIVFTHTPPYSHAMGLSGHGSDMDLRRVLVPLFERYGVDLVLTGHDHHYERSRPILDDEVVDDGCGPVYVVTGGGGASRFARSIAPSRLSARFSRAHHFLRLVVEAGGIEATAIGVDGQPIDAFRVAPFPGVEAARESALCA